MSSSEWYLTTKSITISTASALVSSYFLIIPRMSQFCYISTKAYSYAPPALARRVTRARLERQAGEKSIGEEVEKEVGRGNSAAVNPNDIRLNSIFLGRRWCVHLSAIDQEMVRSLMLISQS